MQPPLEMARQRRNAGCARLAGACFADTYGNGYLARMRLASTTLTGNNASIIGDALRSVVDWVDVCLVIDTGVTDETLRVASEAAGAKLAVRRFEWVQDFAAARNFALHAAQELGASWAITVDTDERIQLNGEDLRAQLSSVSEDVLMMYDEARTYTKERCFRLPARASFEGPTHEAFPGYRVGIRTLARATFHELPKSPAALRAKFERDVAILTRHTLANPGDPRWFFYLGESLANLGQPQAALQAYDTCAGLRGWNEESAWACYRAAECLCKLERYTEAVERCALGLARHAGVAELAWLAAFASYRSGDPAQAVYWAQLALVFNQHEGKGAAVPRIGFRNPSALYEGPHDILRFAYRDLGDTAAAAAAEKSYQQARAARVSGVVRRPGT